MVHLARGLVVPAAPVRAAVHGHDGALVGSRDHVVGMRRVNPQIVIVVAARRALDDLALLPPGGAAVDGAAHRVDRVRIARHRGQPGEIPVDQLLTVVDPLPARPGVVGAVQAAVFLRIDDGVHACSLRRVCGGKPDAAELAVRPAMTREARPVPPAVR